MNGLLETASSKYYLVRYMAVLFILVSDIYRMIIIYEELAETISLYIPHKLRIHRIYSLFNIDR